MTRGSEEDFRQAALVLSKAVESGRFRAALFASAGRGEGTTTSVLAVARQLQSEFGLKPLIVELNAARPTFVDSFGLDEDRTLQSVALGTFSLRDGIQEDDSGIALLACANSGAPRLRSEQIPPVLRQVVEQSAEAYDLVLVDAPPLLESADAMAAASAIEWLVLVVEAGRTRVETLERVKRLIAGEDLSIVGSILNKQKRFIPSWIYRWLIE